MSTFAQTHTRAYLWAPSLLKHGRPKGRTNGPSGSSKPANGRTQRHGVSMEGVISVDKDTMSFDELRNVVGI